MVCVQTVCLPSFNSLALGNSETFIEEPPETPAPMFAVRAFKSALFGTPHPTQPASPSSRSRKSFAQNSLPKESALIPEPSKTEHLNAGDRETIKIPKRLDSDALLSPTKGILLTPGTGTTRRKNVTFRGISSEEKSKEGHSSRDSLLANNISANTSNQLQATGILEDQLYKTSFTKALHKAKYGVSGANVIQTYAVNRSNKRIALDPKIDSSVPVTENKRYDLGVAADVTIDLSNPHSRSGQHWKAEFEQYHRKSGREMKHIIKVNQSVKSFAEKKDLEASELSEKLRKELSKVAAMENKVTDLATQLAAARIKDCMETPDQTKLVNDLARKTAEAIRCKQSAEKYKAALTKRNGSLNPKISTFEDETPQEAEVESSQHKPKSTTSKRQSQNTALLRSELEQVRTKAMAAEQKATKLETENMALQAAINKLRQDMTIFERKRQEREESPQRREAALRTLKADSDAQSLARLSKRESSLQNVRDQLKDTPISKRQLPKAHPKVSSGKIPMDEVATGKPSGDRDNLASGNHAINDGVQRESSKHPDECGAGSPEADIWILGGLDAPLPFQKLRKSQPSGEQPHQILQEIPQNPVRQDENRKPYRTQTSTPSRDTRPPSKTQLTSEFPLISSRNFPSSATKASLTRGATINLPSPSMLTSTSSPPAPNSSTRPSAQQSISSERQEQLKVSPSASTRPKSWHNPASDLAPLAASISLGIVARKEAEKPAAVNRKEASRLRVAARIAEKKKVREEKG